MDKRRCRPQGRHARLGRGQCVVPRYSGTVAPCRVVQIMTPTCRLPARSKYLGNKDLGNCNKPEAGSFREAGRAGTKLVALRTTTCRTYSVWPEITCRLLQAGDLIDVPGVRPGQRFHRRLKRHGFSGQGARHGNHKTRSTVHPVFRAGVRPHSESSRGLRIAVVPVAKQG